MAITLPPLPFKEDALEPHISAKTLGFHYGKHHNGYVTNVNKLVAGTELENMELETLIRKVAGDSARIGVFNNAAQVWNHTFYWNSIRPGGGGPPTGPIADRLKSAFGSYDEFVTQFKTAGATQFGSGWAWLVLDGNDLRVMKTLNADTPLAHGLKPLLTVDVWEHAYYLDYQNRRPDYLGVFVNQLINWDFVNANLTR